jgi:hypothetical protein
LALPTVARRIDTLLYGPPPAELLRPAAARPLAEILALQSVERVSPASFEEFVPDEIRGGRRPNEGLDAPAAEPPPLAPPAAFPPARGAAMPLAQPAPLAEQVRFDAAAMARLKEIRAQLEQLGAEYILLETTDGSGTFRFHCEMKLDGRAPYFRRFEATAAAPLDAAEEVLSQTSAWRIASRPPDLPLP